MFDEEVSYTEEIKADKPQVSFATSSKLKSTEASKSAATKNNNSRLSLNSSDIDDELFMKMTGLPSLKNNSYDQ